MALIAAVGRQRVVALGWGARGRGAGLLALLALPPVKGANALALATGGVGRSFIGALFETGVRAQRAGSPRSASNIGRVRGGQGRFEGVGDLLGHLIVGMSFFNHNGLVVLGGPEGTGSDRRAGQGLDICQDAGIGEKIRARLEEAQIIVIRFILVITDDLFDDSLSTAAGTS